MEFTYKLIPFLNKVSFCNEPLVHYVQREGSISNSQNERTKESFDVLDHVIEFYKENDLYNKFKEQLEYVYARYAFCSAFVLAIFLPTSSSKVSPLHTLAFPLKV